jgi:isopenicillin-N N-acyltransferase-like protein
VHRYFSAASTPYDRGRDFGGAHAREIDGVLDRYRTLFRVVAGREVDLEAMGVEALDSIRDFNADAADEIEGMADGAGQSANVLAALNARTEVLGALGAVTRGECSTVVWLPPDGSGPVSVQTWDWHDLLTDHWFLWTIEHADGHLTHTVTEYGILGKIGVNTRGVGTHINILHHRSDGGPIGVPVHVLARTILDKATDLGGALAMVGAAEVSASSVLTVIGAMEGASSALCAELCHEGPRFVIPSAEGLLIHTNHFLDVHSAAGDLEPRTGPDTFLRYDVLQRALAGRGPVTRDDIVEAMTSHIGLGGAICCHPEDDAALGTRWATLATVSLDVANGTLHAREGGPCNSSAPWISPLTGPDK